MSDIITLTGKVTTSFEKHIQVPSYYKDRHGACIAILRQDMAITMYPDKERPSINITTPESLIMATYNIDVPMEEEAFWGIYNTSMRTIQKLVTPYIPKP